MDKYDGNILIIDDDTDVLFSAELILQEHYSNINCLSSPTKIPTALGKEKYDVVVLDMNFTRGADTGAEGLYWLQQIKQLSPDSQVIMTTAFGDVDLAVEAIKKGAVDFLVKPWEDRRLESTVNACFKFAQSEQKIKRLVETQQLLAGSIGAEFHEIIGDSKPMREVFDLIARVADTSANVLILGENGTGKELVANAIHRKSERAQYPMISVDMGAIPESLFESEMFGHSKGAFTDAKTERPGRFELASGSTLFLDEITNISTVSQAKLLGVLERREITRVGSDKTIPIDIRLISASNVPLKQLLSNNVFRNDLLYRINTVEIFLPPLRERKDDIPLLIKHYLAVFSAKYKKNALRICDSVLKSLKHYHWPGNIRELKHSVEKAVIVSASSKVELEDFSLKNQAHTEKSIDFNLERIEKRTIELAIQQFQGNLTLAAKELGVGRTTLYRKLEKYGISDQ